MSLFLLRHIPSKQVTRFSIGEASLARYGWPNLCNFPPKQTGVSGKYVFEIVGIKIEKQLDRRVTVT